MPLMVNQQPAKFGGDRYCGSGDIIYLVAKEQDSTCSRSNPPFMLSLKYMICYARIHKILQ